MTTREKMVALIEELRTADLSHDPDAGGGHKDIIELFQIVEGLGFHLERFLIPTDDFEADQQIDNLIALLLHLRGDDLPPFSLERHVTEATATDE